MDAQDQLWHGVPVNLHPDAGKELCDKETGGCSLGAQEPLDSIWVQY